ncbi:MAG: hypothetical protein K1X89_07010 [Myxococcaceae bacterium]|nr:hypothetical protein [Myxococcaceae bacterium]
MADASAAQTTPAQEHRPSLAARARWLWRKTATADLRTLALFRIALGTLLLTDLYDRAGGKNLVAFFTNQGLLTNHWALFRPIAPGQWSLLFGLSTETEVRLAFTLIACIYVLFLVGWRTRLMAVLVVLAEESVNWRFLLPQHGGNVVMNILVVWAVFLPLGERWSLDALLRSLRRFPESSVEALNARAFVPKPLQSVSLATLGLSLNFAFIYFFNAANKNGRLWGTGQAVHYVLWVDRMSTAFAAWLRMHEPFWFSPVATYSALIMEWSLPFLILSPVRQFKTRPVVIAFIIALHGGISLMLTLGPFSYSMMAFSMSMPLAAHWAFLEGRLRRPDLATAVRVDFAHPRARLLARVLARLDGLGHLRFEQGAAGKPFSVLQGGQEQVGLAAWAACARALPLGVVLAVPFRVPFLADLARAVVKFVAGFLLESPAVVPETAPAGGPLSRRLRFLPRVALPSVIVVAMLTQLAMESMPPGYKLTWRPQFLTSVVEYLQILQGWSMFAPNPLTDDHRLVVDATLADGTHVDPLTHQPPDFEPYLHGPWGFDQGWGEMHGRMRNWPDHWRNFRDYLMRIPTLEGWPENQRIVALEVWDVAANNPVPGSTEHTDVVKKKLFDQSL